MKLRKSLATAATVLALGGAMAVSTTPASAAGAYISGVGDPMNDWGNEGLISTTSHRYSNVAAMWQAILWANGSEKRDGSTFRFSDIDCAFGPNTRDATMSWQNEHGVPMDGIVGPDTLRHAQSHTAKTGDGRFTYYGSNGYVTFIRSTEGVWGMYIGNDLEWLSYNSATFNVC